MLSIYTIDKREYWVARLDLTGVTGHLTTSAFGETKEEAIRLVKEIALEYAEAIQSMDYSNPIPADQIIEAGHTICPGYNETA